MTHDDAVARITELVALCEAHPKSRGTLSGGERAAVAIILHRADWLTEDGWENAKAACGYYDIPWVRAIQAVQRARGNIVTF